MPPGGKQAAEKLGLDRAYALRIPRVTPVPEWPEEAPLNESHLNLMQSWLNLRGMDNKLARTRYRDMMEGTGKESRP